MNAHKTAHDKAEAKRLITAWIKVSKRSWPTLQQLGVRYVNSVLRYTNGNRNHAAEILGVSRHTVYRWLNGKIKVKPKVGKCR